MLDAIVIGAGMSGILAGIKLQEAGLSDYTILERWDSIGGTWFVNKYPGCACDVPSHFYSYSFEPNPNWSRVYPQQEEILSYFRGVAAKYGVDRKIRFNQEVTSARYVEDEGGWIVETADGQVTKGRVLIFGTGQLSRPLIPEYEGASTFTGKVFHSAEWDHEEHLEGKSVAVIGTGPTAAQFVPEIAPRVKQMVVFQRTPNWILPRLDRPYNTFERWGFKNLPGMMKLYRTRIYLRHESLWPAFHPNTRAARKLAQQLEQVIEAQVPDPELRSKLTPDYPIGCKRIIISDDFLPALQRENVVIETDPIARITHDSIVTSSGRVYPVHTIIYGTGFEATKFLGPIEVTGKDGARLNEAWREGAEAYQGTTVAGFPNMFILYGPNTNLGHNSIIFMVERQVEHMMSLIKTIFRRNLKALAVRPEVMRAYNDEMQGTLENSVWKAGCRSWYMTGSGKVTNNWPYSTITWWRRMRRTDLESFELTKA